MCAPSPSKQSLAAYLQSSSKVSPSRSPENFTLPFQIISPFRSSFASSLYMPFSLPFKNTPFGSSHSGGGPQSSAALITSRADFSSVRNDPLSQPKQAHITVNIGIITWNTSTLRIQGPCREMPVGMAPGSRARTETLLRRGSRSRRRWSSWLSCISWRDNNRKENGGERG